uniref:Oxysterol-binding protein n=1 Tax=Electrophorus electricus TaxID=8005 RepID=A0A4W4EGS0_ELEEL
MPVIFNEPLSFLQRLTEYMEHTYLIHQANASTDSIHRMKCVAAFAVSAVASQWERTGKPFNPLLGETYELIREDLGFRWLSEQVSHHPPVSAFHAEGLKDDFLFHGSIYPKLKFWGKSVEAEPRGIITLELPQHNEAYTWSNPTCCVHNIIVGQLWIEQYGNVEVLNHKTGERCSLTFKSCGLFGKELHKVEGYIYDKSKKKLCAIYGKWTECLYTVDPTSFDLHKKLKEESSMKSDLWSSRQMPPPEVETVEVIPGSELIWKIAPRPENSAQIWPVLRRSGWKKSRGWLGRTGPNPATSGRRGWSARTPSPIVSCSPTQSCWHGKYCTAQWCGPPELEFETVLGIKAERTVSVVFVRWK